MARSSGQLNRKSGGHMVTPRVVSHDLDIGSISIRRNELAANFERIARHVRPSELRPNAGHDRIRPRPIGDIAAADSLGRQDTHEDVGEALGDRRCPVVVDGRVVSGSDCATGDDRRRDRKIELQLGMAERRDFSDRLNEIELPTLAVCGQQDAITTCAEMRSMAESLPNGRFVEIASAGHLAPLEQPAAVNAAIRRFIQAT